MFEGQQSFYFATIRKTTFAFGNIFNNINISRYENAGGKGQILKTIKVPLMYAAGEKWYVKKEQEVQAETKVRTRIVLPAIGFKLTGLAYSPTRKLNSLNQKTKFSGQETPQEFLRQLAPVPYDYSFDVYIAVKNIDDGLQILEQILPYFQPSYNLNIKDIPELAITRDVPATLVGISDIDTYEGQFDEDRTLIYTLSFLVSGYIYPEIKDGEVIRRVFTDFYSQKDMVIESKTNSVRVSVDPIDANIEDDWSTKVEYYDQFDSNGDPINE